MDPLIPYVDFENLMKALPGHWLYISADGILRAASPSIVELAHIIDITHHLNTINLLEDPTINYTEYDLTAILRKALSGKPSIIPNLPTPLETISQRFGTGQPEKIVEFCTWCVMPVCDWNQVITGVLLYYFPEARYPKNKLAVEVKTWLQSNWKEPYDPKVLADAMGLSPSSVLRNFRSAFCSTPFEYYREVKYDHLKLALSDPSISIAQAFFQCGMAYNGSAAAAFKRVTGFSPKEYRAKGYK